MDKEKDGTKTATRYCARCNFPLKDLDPVIQIINGVWNSTQQKVVTLDYGEDTPMVTTYHKYCYRQIVERPSIKGQRIGFYADKGENK